MATKRTFIPSILMLVSLALYLLNIILHTKRFNGEVYRDILIYIAMYSFCLVFLWLGKRWIRLIILLLTVYMLIPIVQIVTLFTIAPIFCIIFIIKMITQITALILLFISPAKT
ncbi:hypothetical protein D3C86_1369180 [compost metagenome]